MTQYCQMIDYRDRRFLDLIVSKIVVYEKAAAIIPTLYRLRVLRSSDWQYFSSVLATAYVDDRALANNKSA